MDPESREAPPELDFKWVDPGVTATRVDVCQVKSTRAETMLLFGTRQPPLTEGERRARLDRRIVLSPALAKQLAAALKSAVREIEVRRGSANATPAGNIRSAPSDADAPAAARPLLDLVRRLDIGFGFEKSLKMSAGSLLVDRIILGVRSKLTDAQALLRICREIGMPPAHLTLFEESLPEANTVGFGFEGGPQGGLFKVYLEFWERVSQRMQRAQAGPEPDLLFLGFKWDAGDSARSAVARYTCYPLLSVKGILSRLDDLYEGRRDSPSLQATQEIIELASRQVGEDSFVYVEAAEEGNPRKSYDINFYKAGLRVAELQPALAALWRRYSIPGEPPQGIDARAAACPFGHLSGGLGRDGQDFLTVYYELEGL
jgi:hypothetical protein